MQFLLRNFDSTNVDADRDRQGCRKRGMCDAELPDSHVWGSEECLPKFVVIKCPEIMDKSELGDPSGFRKIWRDNFDYEILATRPVQGEFDVRVFETAAGLSNQNAMTGVKLTRIRDYLLAWGCSNFAVATGGGSFTFSLWDAVRSANFWNVNITVLATMSFQLNSYTPASGIGNITVTTPTETVPEEILKVDGQIQRKIIERGGSIIISAHPNYTFEINRDDIISKFQADVKDKIEQIYMYQQHRLSVAKMDEAVAAGGTLTLTKAELLAAIVDKAAE